MCTHQHLSAKALVVNFNQYNVYFGKKVNKCTCLIGQLFLHCHCIEISVMSIHTIQQETKGIVHSHHLKDSMSYMHCHCSSFVLQKCKMFCKNVFDHLTCAEK
jgi:hypothetical protein